MPYVRRAIDDRLDAWAVAPGRQPLVMRGARQTGKTAAVRQLGAGFDLFMELNLERRQDRALVAACGSAAELLAALAVRYDAERFPERTLLFLDEIQESPEAVAWLRFFYEDHPEVAVVAAGSLMEVRLQERGFSFPVGRVTFRHLHPFSFFDFLRANGRGVLADNLATAAAALTPIAPAIHDEARRLLRDYLVVGGMPACVTTWAESGNPAAVRQVQSDLLQAFAEDLYKYRGVRDLAYLEAAFESLPHHYGQRFKYEGFAPGYRSAQMKTALTKLEGAMLARRVWPTSAVSAPLRTRPRSAPKLLPLDVGLNGPAMGASHRDLRGLPLDRVLDGRVAEAFVGQQLVSTNITTRDDLHFWVTESARANAEVDYLWPGPGGVLPIEVKPGATGRLRSLHQFLARAPVDCGVRLHDGPLSDERHSVRLPAGPLDYRLVSLPLYLAETIPNLPLPHPTGGWG